jgi:hypothetical protein
MALSATTAGHPRPHAKMSANVPLPSPSGAEALVTYGRSGKCATIGLPGTGLFYSIYEPYRHTGPAKRVRWGLILLIITVMLILLAVIGSKP